jgi:hypothetical protein
MSDRELEVLLTLCPQSVKVSTFPKRSSTIQGSVYSDTPDSVTLGTLMIRFYSHLTIYLLLVASAIPLRYFTVCQSRPLTQSPTLCR